VIGIGRLAANTMHDLPPLLREAVDAVERLSALDAELLFLLRAARLVPEAALDALAAEA
jgi:hypothetical protein